jgi:hypothetical protein|tara:strand:- start:114 stop:542 length:429 start_codon:yes stop_codon:yes gene_type:complete
MDDDELTDEMFEIIKRIADVYENLPAESVAIIMTRKVIGKPEEHDEDGNVDTSLLKEQVSINVIDNLDTGSDDSMVFYLTHGLIELIGENFEEVIELGENRVNQLILNKLAEDEEGNRNFLKDNPSTDATIIKFSDYKKKLH